MENHRDRRGCQDQKLQRSAHRSRSVFHRSSPVGWIAGCLIVLSMLLTGCANVIIESTPSDAMVMWSPNGLSPWHAWPPPYWKDSIPAFDAESETTPTTPIRFRGVPGDYVFVRVDKDGYFTPRPRLLGIRRYRTSHLTFDLNETPEHYAEAQSAKGLVPYQGQWVRPDEYDLVWYEGEWIPSTEQTRRINLSKGLMEFEGEWLTPEAYEKAYTASQESKGLVPFKDRWLRPTQRDHEMKIDAAVKRIRDFLPPEMLPPKVLGRGEGSLSGLGLISLDDHPTRWVLSGPSSRIADLPPQGQISPESLQLIPGRYTIAIFRLDGDSPEAPILDVAPSQNSELLYSGSPEATRTVLLLQDQPLSGGFLYSLTYSSPVLDE